MCLQRPSDANEGHSQEHPTETRFDVRKIKLCKEGVVIGIINQGGNIVIALVDNSDTIGFKIVVTTFAYAIGKFRFQSGRPAPRNSLRIHGI